jgi:hypothetical protein
MRNRAELLLLEIQTGEKQTECECELMQIWAEEGQGLDYPEWTKKIFHYLLGGYTLVENLDGMRRMNNRIRERFGCIDRALLHSETERLSQNYQLFIDELKKYGDEID